jgi:hypothetical protein
MRPKSGILSSETGLSESPLLQWSVLQEVEGAIKTL